MMKTDNNYTVCCIRFLQAVSEKLKSELLEQRVSCCDRVTKIGTCYLVASEVASTRSYPQSLMA